MAWCAMMQWLRIQETKLISAEINKWFVPISQSIQKQSIKHVTSITTPIPKSNMFKKNPHQIKVMFTTSFNKSDHTSGDWADFWGFRRENLPVERIHVFKQSWIFGIFLFHHAPYMLSGVWTPTRHVLSEMQAFDRSLINRLGDPFAQ